MHRTVFTHVFSTQKTFDTEKLVHTDCTQIFYRPTLLHGKLYPEQNLHSRTFFAQKPLYTKTNTLNIFYRQTVLTRRKFSAQNSYAQKVLRTTFFTYRRFYTQMSLHRHKLHTETCAHSTRLHTATFCTERLCFPFLITHLSCSPSQIFICRKHWTFRYCFRVNPAKLQCGHCWQFLVFTPHVPKLRYIIGNWTFAVLLLVFEIIGQNLLARARPLNNCPCV